MTSPHGQVWHHIKHRDHTKVLDVMLGVKELLDNGFRLEPDLWIKRRLYTPHEVMKPIDRGYPVCQICDKVLDGPAEFENKLHGDVVIDDGFTCIIDNVGYFCNGTHK